MICKIITGRDLEQKRTGDYKRLIARGNEIQDDK